MGGHRTNNLIIARIATDIALLGAVLFSHWIVVCVIAIIGAFLYPRFIELIIAGVMIDLLYGVGAVQFFSYPAIFATSGLIVYIGIQYLRTRMRYYHDR